MNPSVLQELKTLLEKEKETLHAELRSIATPDPKMKGDWDAQFPQFETEEYGSHASLEEEADEVEEYESKLAAEQSLESRLVEVEKALERIEKGTYGVCAQCGQEISLERLRANPAAECDVEHAS